ncbi:hypothetical protein [Secundilactobacillus paracollinoides]|nr:hypothetical protein [Secundilactobacillus paracollinoides]
MSGGILGFIIVFMGKKKHPVVGFVALMGASLVVMLISFNVY